MNAATETPTTIPDASAESPLHRAPLPGYDPTKPGYDTLPERNGESMRLVWWAVTSDDTPQAGFVKIMGKRDSTTYVVSEFPTTWGRGFFLSKFVSKSGTDKDSESYSVLCSASGEASDACDCRGAQRWGHCKHRDAMRCLIANGWV